ncbi:MAG: hypothetical protein H7Y31_10950 [Chitinophagaceae bacterium]|nr:hypothetical protein [Chitinophagaceae bacterium]
MKQHVLLFSTVFFCIALSCNNKEPFKLPYDNLGSYVIGSETCNADDSQNYWLLDFTVYPNSPHIGDTLILNSITYSNVLKVKGLDARLKQVGMRVSIDYKIITPDKVFTTGCTVNTPITYHLKEMTIINQFEMR